MRQVSDCILPNTEPVTDAGSKKVVQARSGRTRSKSTQQHRVTRAVSWPCEKSCLRGAQVFLAATQSFQSSALLQRSLLLLFE